MVEEPEPEQETELMIALDVVNPQSGHIEAREILTGDRTSETLTVRPVPGSSAILLRVSGDATLVREVQASGEEPVTVDVYRTDDSVQVRAPSRHVFALPPGTANDYTILSPHADKAADIAFLLDATALAAMASGQTAAQRFVSFFDTEAWTALAVEFEAFVGTVAKAYGNEVRTAVLAFGDYAVPPVTGRPYVVHPPESWQRRLKRWDPGQFGTTLRRVSPASGGDLVDALADGLAAAADCEWKENARKLLVLAGDSPGYSVLDARSPVLQLCDARVRAADVYEQAHLLHAAGVEIATVYCNAATAELEITSDTGAAIVEHTRRQYLRLASQPSWNRTSSEFSGASFAGEWLAHAHPLGRGACPPIVSAPSRGN